MASIRFRYPLGARWPARALVVGLALLVTLPWSGATRAQPQPGRTEAPRVARERERIQVERERLEAQFTVEQSRCAERFAVTACVDEVRQRRRAALAVPKAQDQALDDAERRERAAARRQAVLDKQRRAAEMPSPAPAAPASVAQVPRSAPALQAVVKAPPRSPNASASAAAAQRAAAGRQRQSDIKAGQARIEAREAARVRSGKAAAGLPAPAVSAPAAR